LMVWALAQSCGNGYRSLVTLERVLSEYNEDFIFILEIIVKISSRLLLF